MDVDELKYKNDNDVAEIFTSFEDEIEQLEEEIRMLKQYQQIAINDKHHRKKRLNKALEEIKQLKTK